MARNSETKLQFSPGLLSIISVWLGAVILCIPAMLNNFPFIYADSGTYLACGFKAEISEIRPMIYGLFIRHVSLLESLWFVIFVQGLIISWTIHSFFRAFSQRAIGMRPLTAIMILTIMTCLGEVSGMLMPDFLTSLMILCGAILLFCLSLTWWRTLFISIIFWFAIASHHSHAYIITGVLFITIAIRLILYWKHKTDFLPLRRLVLLGSLTLAGYFTIPLLHLHYGGAFYWSTVKSIFITNRVNQMGLLKPFLRENCPSHNYRLCASIDTIPFDLLWDPKSPLRTSGGFMVNDHEYGLMLKDFFKKPIFVRKFIIKSLENGILQFFTIEGLVITREMEWGFPYNVVKDVWPDNEPAMRRSMQYLDRWKSNLTQVFQRFLVYGSYLFLLWGFVFSPEQRFTSLQRRLVGFIMLSLFANAMFCAGISMVDVRFQYRIVWLVPLLVIWLLGEYNLKEIFLKKREE